jgi:hypothetical protein
MAQRAISMQGIDEISRVPVRIELKVVTGGHEEPTLPLCQLSAPRGYLPSWAAEPISSGGRSELGSAESRREEALSVLGGRGFSAPRGFVLPSV